MTKLQSSCEFTRFGLLVVVLVEVWGNLVVVITSIYNLVGIFILILLVPTFYIINEQDKINVCKGRGALLLWDLVCLRL
jgi:hypothetical protein